MKTMNVLKKSSLFRINKKFYVLSKIILNIDNLIETNQLNDLLNDDKLKSKLTILDCSWFLPTENKNGKDLFDNEKIPFSKFFDIDNIADKSLNLPHMFPTEDIFIKNTKELDIRKDDLIICYDRSGIFSSPRVWFTFKLFGAKNVAVLNGGFPKWSRENLPIAKKPYIVFTFFLHFRKKLFVNQVLKKTLIINSKRKR